MSIHWREVTGPRLRMVALRDDHGKITQRFYGKMRCVVLRVAGNWALDPSMINCVERDCCILLRVISRMSRGPALSPIASYK